MHPHVTVLTLGVNDLEASFKFYREGLGLPSSGLTGSEFAHGRVAFFDLQDDLKLALYPRSDIAWDANMPASAPSPTEFTIGHNVSSKSEVDAIMVQAERAGATITDRARDRFWGGYSGYFQDPERHLWEVAWNPDWQ